MDSKQELLDAYRLEQNRLKMLMDQIEKKEHDIQVQKEVLSQRLLDIQNKILDLQFGKVVDIMEENNLSLGDVEEILSGAKFKN